MPLWPSKGRPHQSQLMEEAEAEAEESRATSEVKQNPQTVGRLDRIAVRIVK